MPNWNNQLGGLWATGTNWSMGSAPNASGAQAIMNASFAPGITAPINVDLGSAYWTVGTLDLTYNGVQNYVLTQGTVGMQTVGFSEVEVRGTSHFFSSSANLDIVGTTDIILHDASAQLHLQGDLSGFGSLYVYGLGSLVLYGANTHSGAKYINSGSINIDNGSGLGTGSLNFINDPSLNPGTDGTGSLFSSATISVSNEITTANGTQPRFGTVGGTTLTLTGPISFFGNSTTDIHIFNLASSGTVELAPSSASIQPDVEIYIDAGKLKIGSAAGATLVGGAQSVTIASLASLDIGGNNVTLKNVQGSGSITNSSGLNSLTLQVASNQTLSPTVVAGAGLIELVKTGAGTLTIDTPQSPSLVTIQTGTLALSANGSLASASSGVQTVGSGTFDISGIAGSVATVVELNNNGITVLGNKLLNVTAQSSFDNAGVGAFDGGSGAGRVSFNLAGATTNFGLSLSSFTNWGPEDQIQITGNANFQTLTGSSNADTIIAVFNPSAVALPVSGDSLVGGLGNDTLRSSAGWDTLDGGGDNDTADFSAATGGFGAQLDSSGNALVAAPGLGLDTLFSIEALIGGAGNDTLVGNASNNTLDGRAGNDALSGGGGDDTYIIDSSSDSVVAGAGIDSVISSASYIMAANVENLTLTGTGQIDGIGNSLDNTLTGNDFNNSMAGEGGNDTLIGAAGDDTLNGNTGADSMVGGSGVDSYFVDNAGDAVVETEVGATLYDTVWSTLANYTLPVNTEIYIALGGAGSINGTGNNGITLMLGNEGANILNSLGGNDIILGRDGNDTINSGAGGDPAGYEVISGGIGADSLTGGGGHDYFNYELITHGGDTITDFATSAGIEDDILDFRPMFPTFTNIAGITTVAQAVASGHLTYTQSGANVLVFADADGGSGPETLMATILNQTAAAVQTYTLI